MPQGAFPPKSCNSRFMRSWECVPVPGSPPCWCPFADWWWFGPWGTEFEIWGRTSVSWCRRRSSLSDWHTCWSPSKRQNTQCKRSIEENKRVLHNITPCFLVSVSMRLKAIKFFLAAWRDIATLTWFHNSFISGTFWTRLPKCFASVQSRHK